MFHTLHLTSTTCMAWLCNPVRNCELQLCQPWEKNHDNLKAAGIWCELQCYCLILQHKIWYSLHTCLHCIKDPEEEHLRSKGIDPTTSIRSTFKFSSITNIQVIKYLGKLFHSFGLNKHGPTGVKCERLLLTCPLSNSTFHPGHAGIDSPATMSDGSSWETGWIDGSRWYISCLSGVMLHLAGVQRMLFQFRANQGENGNLTGLCYLYT